MFCNKSQLRISLQTVSFFCPHVGVGDHLFVDCRLLFATNVDSGIEKMAESATTTSLNDILSDWFTAMDQFQLI